MALEDEVRAIREMGAEARDAELRRLFKQLTPEEQKAVTAHEARRNFQEEYKRMNDADKGRLDKFVEQSGVSKQEHENYLKGSALPLRSTQDRVVNALMRADMERVQAARRNLLAGRGPGFFRSR